MPHTAFAAADRPKRGLPETFVMRTSFEHRPIPRGSRPRSSPLVPWFFVAFVTGALAACAHGGATSAKRATAGSVATEPIPTAVNTSDAVGATSLTSADVPAAPLRPEDRSEGARSDDMTLTGIQGSDLAVTELIHQRLAEAGFDESREPLEIVTTAGNVVLRGRVGSPAERDDVERIVRLVSGVAGVDNRLTTEHSVFPDAAAPEIPLAPGRPSDERSTPP